MLSHKGIEFDHVRMLPRKHIGIRSKKRKDKKVSISSKDRCISSNTYMSLFQSNKGYDFRGSTT